MRSTLYILMMVLAGGLLTGCTGQPYMSDSRLNRGLVLVFTGIEGRSPFNTAIADGLDEGGVKYAIELVDWTMKVPGSTLVNLRSEERNRRKAEQIAERIARYQIGHPGRPVVLVGQSGGAAMALWSAEAIPFGQKVDGIVLLAASISPEYDLRYALAKSRRGVANFYSSTDWFFLGIGTTVFGTMDAEHGQSAGRVGFKPAVQAAAQPYDKLFQIAWSEQMARQGNFGLHLTSGASGFVKAFVCPLVLSPQWNSQLISQIQTGRMKVAAPPSAQPPAPNPVSTVLAPPGVPVE